MHSYSGLAGGVLVAQHQVVVVVVTAAVLIVEADGATNS
jgi:hypothetical protein